MDYFGDLLMTTGTWTSVALNKMTAWIELTWSKTTPPGTAITVDILNGTTGTVIASDVSSGYDLSALTQSQLKIRANLSSTTPGNTPTLVSWSVSCTGTAGFKYDDQNASPTLLYDVVYF